MSLATMHSVTDRWTDISIMPTDQCRMIKHDRLTQALHRPWCPAWQRSTYEGTADPGGQQTLWLERGSVHTGGWWNDSRCRSEQHQYKMCLFPTPSSIIIIITSSFVVVVVILTISSWVFKNMLLSGSKCSLKMYFYKTFICDLITNGVCICDSIIFKGELNRENNMA